MPQTSSSQTPRRRLSSRPSKKVIREFNDRGALWLLEDPANLRDLLRLLEPDLADLLDFSRAERVPRTFIPADLRKRESDLMVSVPFRDSAGGELWVYVLLEHQSRPDRWMAARLFLYMALTRFVPCWETLRLHLHEMAPETLTQFASGIGWALRALQAADQPLSEMERVLAEAMAGLEGLTEEQAGQWERAAWYLVMLVLYRRDEPEIAEKRVEQARGSKFGGGEEITRMGRSIIEQVRSESEARGEAGGIRHSLVRVLTQRYGPLPTEIAAALEQADVARMNAWLETAATAASLEEIGIVPHDNGRTDEGSPALQHAEAPTATATPTGWAAPSRLRR